MAVDVNLLGESCVVRTARLMSTQVQKDVVLLDAEAGKYYGFDAIGSDIWARLEHPITLDALSAALITDYAGDPAQIRKDVVALLTQLIEAGLVQICQK